MVKSFRFLIGVCVGTAMLAFPVASAALYVLTGRVAIPEAAGGGLLTPEQLADRVHELTDRALEQCHG